LWRGRYGTAEQLNWAAMAAPHHFRPDSALKSLTSSEGRIHGCNVLPAVGMPAIEKTMTVLP